MKIVAVLDLDTNRDHGDAPNTMVANNSKRSELARDYSASFSGREQTNAFFAKLFDPALVAHDELEEHATFFLALLQPQCKMVYLASRPHTMREATDVWLKAQGVYYPVIYKNYGSGEKREDGTYDNGDRFMKTTAWKKREVERLLAEENPDILLFADDEEANRLAVAEIEDPRVLIRCSLQDAACHDIHPPRARSSAPFLARLQELAEILEMREALEMAEEPYSLHIAHPEIPGGEQRPLSSITVEAWDAATFAPEAAPQGQRFYRYREFYPQRNEMSEVEQLVSLECTCDQSGRVASVKMARPGPALSLLDQLEETFDMAEQQEMAQKYADEWIAHAIEEFGYVAAARAQRGIQLFGKAALDTYAAHVQAKNEALTLALRSSKAEQE
jgi:hypothetical protein